MLVDDYPSQAAVKIVWGNLLVDPSPQLYGVRVLSILIVLPCTDGATATVFQENKRFLLQRNMIKNEDYVTYQYQNLQNLRLTANYHYVSIWSNSKFKMKAAFPNNK